MIKRILVLRHHTYMKHFYDIVLYWVSVRYPEYLPLFDVRELPCDPVDLSGYALHVPWLQDPVQAWSAECYALATSLAARCAAEGIPVINPVDRLQNAGKSTGAARIAAAGLRTPKTVLISDHERYHDDLCGLRLPILIREDWGHQQRWVRADTLDEARRVSLQQFTRPVASEVWDVRSPDGLYRKYRCIVAGDEAVANHVQTSTNWLTRDGGRVVNELTTTEEVRYIHARDRHEAQFVSAARSLELDYVAFDYGYGLDGQPIVWEANPLPLLRFHEKELAYTNFAMNRVLRALLRMYLQRARIEVPATLLEASFEASLAPPPGPPA